MRLEEFLQCLLILTAAMAVSLPSQAAMVGTAQLQANQSGVDLGNITAKRD